MKSTNLLEKYIELFRTASSARSGIDKYRKAWEEFYWNDVDSTKSQFDKKQKAEINKLYNIPLSTKLSYPIIEQMLAFLTGTKPFPKIIGATEDDALLASTYQEAYKAVWYESNSTNELKNALRDLLVVGTGWLRVRTNDFFNESSYNVLHEYIRWKHVYVDPECRKEDLSDAEYIILAYPMPKSKAEKKYDVTIKPSEHNTWSGLTDADDDTDGQGYYSDNQSDKRTVVIKEFYEKEEKSVYISENGDISLKRPKLIEIPNPKIQELTEQINIVTAQLQELNAVTQEQSSTIQQMQQVPSAVRPAEGATGLVEEQGLKQDFTQNSQQAQMMEAQLQELYSLLGQEPPTIPAYKMENEKGEEVISLNPVRTTKKRIRKTLIVGDEILESEYLPFENYPIVAFHLQHAGLINKTYGIMHYILDMQKFLNKTYSALIYDMQTNNRPKVMVAKGSLVNPEKFESQWSKPSAMIEYHPNPELPDGGRPTIINPSPMSQVSAYVIQDIAQRVEYVTGIHGVMMGDGNATPNTASATSSLQNFGSQRIKHYARAIEPALRLLAASTIEHLQHYAPKDKILKYIDEEFQEQSFQLLSLKDDLRFKIRIDIVNDLPTVKQATVAMLSSVAGQTSNPFVADALTKEMLKLLEIPKMVKLAEEIDPMKQLQQQNQQLQQQVQALEGQVKTFQHNQVQSEAKHKVEKAEVQAKADLEVQKNNIANSMQNTEPTLNNMEGDW